MKKAKQKKHDGVKESPRGIETVGAFRLTLSVQTSMRPGAAFFILSIISSDDSLSLPLPER